MHHKIEICQQISLQTFLATDFWVKCYNSKRTSSTQTLMYISFLELQLLMTI